jgi:hypothetical protein
MDRRDRDEFEIARAKSRGKDAGVARPILAAGNLGRVETIANLPTAGPSTFQILADVRGDDERAIVMTVGLFAEVFAAPALALTQVRAAARLSFGVAGVQAVAEVDIPVNGFKVFGPNVSDLPNAGGQILSVPASFLRVEALNETIGAVSFPLRIGAFFSYQTVGLAKAPTRTRYFDFLVVPLAPAAFSGLEPIPRFSTSFRFLRFPAEPVRVRMFNAGGGLVLDEVAIAAGAASPEFAVPADAAFVGFFNDGAGAIDRGRFVFSLIL